MSWLFLFSYPCSFSFLLLCLFVYPSAFIFCKRLQIIFQLRGIKKQSCHPEMVSTFWCISFLLFLYEFLNQLYKVHTYNSVSTFSSSYVCITTSSCFKNVSGYIFWHVHRSLVLLLLDNYIIYSFLWSSCIIFVLSCSLDGFGYLITMELWLWVLSYKEPFCPG
jgi:hypothetical protein